MPLSWKISAILAFIAIGAAFAYRFYYEPTAVMEYADGARVPLLPSPPTPGKEGSAHNHASLLLMLDGKRVNFCNAQFMLKSPLTHFEDMDCTTVHTHATGISFTYFLSSIGVSVTSSCITLPRGDKHCTNSDKEVRVVLNGLEIVPEDLARYEIRNNDHILINYGVEREGKLIFLYNQVPDIPLEVNPPRATLEGRK